MMRELEKIPTTIPLSDINKRAEELFAQLKKTHLLITRQGKEAGVLVHPTVWNRIVDYIDELEDLVDALEVERDLATGRKTLITIDPDTWEEIQHGAEEAKSAPAHEQVLA